MTAETPLTRPSPLRGLLAVLALVTCVLLGTATAAQAHTALGSSNPADGGTVTGPLPTVDLTFTGPVLLREVTVTGPAGTSATAGPAAASDAVVTQPVALTAAGTYTVGYAVTSSDGHPVEGTFSFAYDPPVPPAPTGEVAPSSTAGPSATVEASEAVAESRAQESAGLPGWVLPAAAAVVLAAAVLLVVLRRSTRR